MMGFKDLTELTPVRLQEIDVLTFMGSRGWLAFCQSLRTKQQLLNNEAKRATDAFQKALLYEKVELIDEILGIPSEMLSFNIGEESGDSLTLETKVREQLKGDCYV